MSTPARATPGTFRVERSIRIKASPEAIFPFLNEFRKWALWSPYEKLDPNLRKTYVGPEGGPGAVYAWSGAGKAGAGRMEITDASAPTRVIIKLDFSKPFQAHNITEFTLLPEREGAHVTWAMHGPTTWITRLIGIFIDMDRMIGKDFEAGLSSLKTLAERTRSAEAEPVG